MRGNPRVTAPPPAATLTHAFAADRTFLWGLCYRMTGCAADAEDIVQETFARALERPPARTDDPWRPWLTRVAMNLARDLLRRRRRQRYVGPWLPSPIETGDEAAIPAVEPVLASGDTTAGRYDVLESVSYAFLIALEALTPQQRAVLLLRDVFDYDVREAADVLGISESSVKVTHHRARARMATYDRQRRVPTHALQQRTRTALEQLLAALVGGDPRAMERLLAAGVRAVSDGGGEFHAARVPLVGPQRVARFYVNAATRGGHGARTEIRMVNGLPALLVWLSTRRPGYAPMFVTRIELDPAGQVERVYSVLATRKLTAIAGRTDAPTVRDPVP
jgi:RNA polymerase sigma factor (sigma-70 family)